MARLTTTEALKDLFTAFGGNASTVADLVTDSEIIKALADHIAAGGAAELPSVSSPGDDGKVLTVVDGAWAAAALPADNTET